MSKITKLGLGINCFEGTEHLKNIIYEIRNAVDVIMVGAQKVSYFGEKISQEDLDELYRLQKAGYIDELVWFDIKLPEKSGVGSDDRNKIPRLAETEKRNKMLDHLQKAGCSHSLVIDSDEFYDRQEFYDAKQIISETEDIHCTYCQYVNYYRDYHHYLVWPFPSFVPFITESSYRFVFDDGDFHAPSDPTRRYKKPEGDESPIYIFDWDVLHMHHFAWIRKDITKKIDNWSAKKYFEGESQLIPSILDRYKNYHDGENAIVTFNVPGFSVMVNPLPKEYIHPHYFLNSTDLEAVPKDVIEEK